MLSSSRLFYRDSAFFFPQTTGIREDEDVFASCCESRFILFSYSISEKHCTCVNYSWKTKVHLW